MMTALAGELLANTAREVVMDQDVVKSKQAIYPCVMVPISSSGHQTAARYELTCNDCILRKHHCSFEANS